MRFRPDRVRNRHIIAGILAGLQPGVAAALMMACYGAAHWGLLLAAVAAGAPLAVLTARNAAFRKQFPDFEQRDFERRMRG